MSEKIVQVNEEVIKGQLKELVRGSVEEMLNEPGAGGRKAVRYERNEAQQEYRIGHYDRNLSTTSGEVTLHVSHLKGISFEMVIIERCRWWESSVEETLIELCLAGVLVHRIEDITEVLSHQPLGDLRGQALRHHLEVAVGYPIEKMENMRRAFALGS